MRVLVTGGAGYIGSVLVPKLLKAGHDVAVVDIGWFGSSLAGHPRLWECSHDLADFGLRDGDADTVIHLAAVANDPVGELAPELTWRTNALGTERLAHVAAKSGVEHFIFASSGSVYGISQEENVTEACETFPLSEYNKTKMVAERCVLSYGGRMAVSILRPATVCGYSPRQRLDVIVNSFVMQALTKGEITFNGGEQYRPNIHIEDMTDLYLWMVERPGLTGIWNAGFENMRIDEIARLVAEATGAKVKAQPSTDPRSYRMNSDKLLRAGFRPQHCVKDAIQDLCNAYVEGKLKDEDKCYNLKTMKKLGL